MKPILSAILSLLAFRFRRRASLELEVIALRHQLMVLQRQYRRNQLRRPWFQHADRVFWAWLYKIWPQATKWLVLIKPRTVVRWHEQGYCLYWTWRANVGGRHKIDREIIRLIREMSEANPLWGAPRIHGELLKLGIVVSQNSVRKYMLKRALNPSPGWRTFIRSQMRDTAAVDMFVVITVTFRLLYAVVVLGHDRRRIIHIGVTKTPRSEERRVGKECRL